VVFSKKTGFSLKIHGFLRNRIFKNPHMGVFRVIDL